MLPCNYEEDKNQVPMNKPYNIQNTNICNGIFHISFVKGETTRYRPDMLFPYKWYCHLQSRHVKTTSITQAR